MSTIARRQVLDFSDNHDKQVIFLLPKLTSAVSCEAWKPTIQIREVKAKTCSRLFLLHSLSLKATARSSSTIFLLPFAATSASIGKEARKIEKALTEFCEIFQEL